MAWMHEGGGYEGGGIRGLLSMNGALSTMAPREIYEGGRYEGGGYGVG